MGVVFFIQSGITVICGKSKSVKKIRTRNNGVMFIVAAQFKFRLIIHLSNFSLNYVLTVVVLKEITSLKLAVHCPTRA